MFTWANCDMMAFWWWQTLLERSVLLPLYHIMKTYFVYFSLLYCKDEDLDPTYLIVYLGRTRSYCDMMTFGDGKHYSNGCFVYISHLYYKVKNLESTYLIATEISLSSFDRSSGATECRFNNGT